MYHSGDGTVSMDMSVDLPGTRTLLLLMRALAAREICNGFVFLRIRLKLRPICRSKHSAPGFHPPFSRRIGLCSVRTGQKVP